ncbi:two-component regulator propeller domain-containing protein [Mesonia aestuariivivens]|uniref:Helix-turn-helix domain-containing protein n=1 Tax=Mesonia aestuariivivens TaxID=2796128 RepID=A0ABS6W2L2_9FLAO|nr:two-component regulator propeller domain-containing protein [Mesonia aestuariivivens]MBW2962093.1 helix-turn-helix domain-containing protein [Mesonia aestuariivivens]
MIKSPSLHISYLLCFLIGSVAFAQHLKFKSFTTKEGLSNNSVKNMSSDKQGRLWIGTWDGLNRYDGQNITVFKYDLQDNTGISGNVIKDLNRDIHQNIWILTDNKSVSRYIGDGVFQQFHFQKQPLSLALTHTGEIAVKMPNGYRVFSHNQFKEISKENIKNSDRLGVLKNFLLQNHPDLQINDILKDSKGNIWYATKRNGLYIIPNTPQNVKNELIEHYTHDTYSPYSFNSNEIEKIYQDDFGNIWLAHKDGGISMAYAGSEQITTIFPHPTKFPHLPNESIRAITKDNQSNIWLGYYTKGIYHYSEKTKCYLAYQIQEAKANPDWYRIRSFYTDSNGHLWVGTYAGLVKITPKGYQLFKAETHADFPNNRNYAFQEDEQQKLWIACWGGLAKLNLNTDTFEAFPHQKDLAPFHVRHVIKHQDTLVMATENQGVIFFTEAQGVIKRLTTKDGITGNSIYKLYHDQHTGYYWIATLGGVSIYDFPHGVIKNITEESGLPSHMVYGLLENKNKVWLSTTKGIATIQKKGYEVAQLPKDQGWQAEEFSEGAVYQDEKGMLFFGGISGLSYLQPNAYHYAVKTPKLQINIDGKELYPNVLTKAYQENTFTFSAIPIQFSGVAPKIYYQLEGVDKDWKLYQNKRITYKNLEPGRYSLLTKMNTKGSKSKKHIILEIETPFYQTSPFYLLIFGAILLIGVMIILRKNWLAKRLHKIMEAKIEARTRMIETQKLELLQANQHLEERHKELNAQQQQVLELHHQLKDRDFEVDKFKTFVLNSFKPKLANLVAITHSLKKSPESKQLEQELTQLIRKISEWDYLDQIAELGTLVPSEIHFKKLIQTIYRQLQSFSFSFDFTLKYQILTVSDLISLDVLRVKLLFQYLIHEVIKYVEQEASLILHTSLTENEMLIELSSSSSLLNEQWENIINYSPYYKAVKVLINDLGGELVKNTNEFKLRIHLPILNVTKVASRSGIVLLKHLEDDAAKLQPSILVYCEEEEVQLVHHLLEGMAEPIIFEHEVNALPSALQQINVKALVVYNAQLTSAFVEVISQPAFKILPSAYIAEQIDLALEEQALDYGLKTVIYLPIDKSFLQKKMNHLIQQYQKTHHTGFLDKLLPTAKTEALNLNPHQKLVKQALALIREEIGNAEFNVDRLISELEISRTKCYRVFKEVLHQSPSEVIIGLRLQNAEKLLGEGNLNVSEISFECGFKDPKYFSRMFKKHYGSSPKNFQLKQNH